MIKARITTGDGKAVYLLGLSDKNLEKLREGRPISLHLEDMGGNGQLVLMWGRTEADIARELSDMIGPETVVSGLDKMGDS